MPLDIPYFSKLKPHQREAVIVLALEAAMVATAVYYYHFYK